jgi:CspA family cold shock protein
MNTKVPVTNAQDVLTGRVKWFNNKSGFGFITVTDGSEAGNDIFVHHSAVKVDSEQYKYLVQGEYVEFSLVETQDSKYTCQASNVSGIKGGKLMCETRREFREARNSYRNPTDEEQALPVRRESTQSRPAKVRGPGPREEGEWNYVPVSRDADQQLTSVKPKAARGRKPKPKATDA